MIRVRDRTVGTWRVRAGAFVVQQSSWRSRALSWGAAHALRALLLLLLLTRRALCCCCWHAAAGCWAAGGLTVSAHGTG